VSTVLQNREIAHKLREVALLLDEQGANRFRIHGERQCTVVTGQSAPFTKKRIVRGRKAECESYYHSHKSGAAVGVSEHRT